MQTTTGGLDRAITQLDTEPLIKAADAEVDDNEKDDEEDDMTDKSLPNKDDLLKSLDALAATGAAADAGISIRSTQLHARAASGDLTADERTELAKSLLQDDLDAGPLYKSHAEDFAADPTVASGLEISDFLEAQTDIIAKSLDDIHEQTVSQGREQSAFNGVLSKALSDIGRVVAAQQEQITELHSLVKSAAGLAPQAPLGVTRPSRVGQTFGENLTKSNEPQAPAGNGRPEDLAKALNGLTDDQVMDTMEDMIQKSDGGIVNGVDVNQALIKYESTRMMDGNVLAAVAQHRGMG